MYFWKCFRDTRGRFFSFLTVMVIGGFLLAYLQPLDRFARAQGIQLHITAIEAAWRHTVSLFVMSAGILAAVAGLMVGASGIGQEFEQGSLLFLLTRPRTRRYYVWMGWAVGAAELFVLSSLGALTAFSTLVLMTHTIHDWQLAQGILVLFIWAILPFGLCCLLSSVARGTRNGLVLCLALTTAYMLGIPFINFQWELHLPTPVDLVGRGAQHFPWTTAATWLLVALAFPLIQQFTFERADL